MISLHGTPLVAALATLFPELPKQLQVTVVQEELSPDQVKFRLLDAVATLLERMGQEQPVLLCIDNLQWADSASLELTLYLTVRLHSSRVALVGVTRPPEMPVRRVQESQESSESDVLDADSIITTPRAAMAATQALGELMRQGLLLLLPLAPLSEEAVTQHIQHLLPGTLGDNVTTDLLARAGGNPFFLEELVRALTLNRQLSRARWHLACYSHKRHGTAYKHQASRWRATTRAKRRLPRPAARGSPLWPYISSDRVDTGCWHK